MGEKPESWLPVVTDQWQTQRSFLEMKICYILDIPHGPGVNIRPSSAGDGGSGVKIRPSSAGDAGSVPGQRTKIPPAVRYGQKRFVSYALSLCKCHSGCQYTTLITHILCQNLYSCTLQTCAFLYTNFTSPKK